MNPSDHLSTFLLQPRSTLDQMNASAYLEAIERVIVRIEDWSVLCSQPLLSVWMSTYNHEAYINQALDSILMQRTSFAYEIVIGDDKSTDYTCEILREYQRCHPDKIRLRLANENLYSKGIKQSIGALHACRGKYVALCEGDDYWTNPTKLQQQINFLERHQDFAITFHAVYKYYEDGSQPPVLTRPKPRKSVYQLEDLLFANYIHSPTVIFRNCNVSALPSWYFSLAIGDWPLHILNARYGKIAYIDEPMAVYRIHPGGLFSGANQIQRLESVIQMYQSIKPDLAPEYHEAVRSGLSTALLSQAVALLDNGDTRQSYTYMVQSLRVAPAKHLLAWPGLFLRRLAKLIDFHLKTQFL